MKFLSGLILCILAVFLVAGAGCILLDTPSQPVEDYEEQTALVQMLVEEIAGSTSEISTSLLSAAEYQGAFSADEPAVVKNLSDLYVHHPSSTSIYRVNCENVVVAAVPVEAENRIGYHIENFTFDPTNMSTPLEVGLYHRQSRNSIATSLMAPVFSADGEYAGYIAFVMNPDLFFGPSLAAVNLEQGEAVFILNEAGDILYCPENTEIGKNVIHLADSVGFDTAGVLSRMVCEKSGTVTLPAYSYGHMKYITLASAWDTLETEYGNVTIVVGKMTNSQWTVTLPSASTNETLEAFVTSAYLYATENGREEAPAAFNDPNGPFASQQYVIAAFDMNATLLADPLRPDYIGSDRSALADPNGVQILRALVQRAAQGGGYVMYLHPDAMHDQRMEIKLSYILPVDTTWFVVSGTYLDEEPTYADPDLNNEMINYVRSVKQYALENGRNATIAELNNPEGIFYREDIRLIGVAANGTILARPHHPDLIGASITGITDVYAGSIGRDVLSSLQPAGWMQYQYMPNQTTHESEMSLIYTLPVDDTRFLVAGIPLTQKP